MKRPLPPYYWPEEIPVPALSLRDLQWAVMGQCIDMVDSIRVVRQESGVVDPERVRRAYALDRCAAALERLSAKELGEILSRNVGGVKR